MLKIGTKVKIIGGEFPELLEEEGVIVEVDNDDMPYDVYIEKIDDRRWFKEQNIEEVKGTVKKRTRYNVVDGTLEQIVAEKAMPFVKEKINEQFGDLFKNITTIAVNTPEGIKETTHLTHKKFKDILTLVSNKIPVMLTGGAGSGKTSTCEKIAKALGLEFYFTNAITQEYKLTGFIDANGNFHETQFYTAFKDGGLFVLDEIDASIPEALVILNTAIANGYFDFPNGRVVANENFRIVACANTYGLGADDVYVGRYQLDGASLDRFAVVEFDYDETLEKSLVENIEWAEFIQSLRKRIGEKQIRHVLSMRATIYGDKLLKTDISIKEILKEIVFKNLKIDDIKSIGTINANNQYAHEYNEIVESGAF